MRKFAEKYAIRFGRIIPATEMEANCDDAYFLFNDPQKRLYQMRKVEEGIKERKHILNDIRLRLSESDFGLDDMRDLLSIHVSDFMSKFFEDLEKEIMKHINTRQELKDFAISEQKLGEFCEKEGLPDPDELYGKEGDKLLELPPEEKKHFDLDLLGEEACL